MNKIDWTPFDGAKFQAFCNVLFSFEISKSFIAFDAPGKDLGIDGWYDGEYNGKTGKWRFQSKFHHPTTGRSSGFTQFFNEIKKDLKQNINNENNLVFITNIEINPAQREKINVEISTFLESSDSRNLNIEIWDGSKLQSLLVRHPLVLLWYTEDYKIWLQDYKEFYKSQLIDNSSLSYNLSNNFYYRSSDFDILNEFIENDINTCLLITGEAGIGKTRLCIEFFKKFVEPKKGWISLVVVSHQLNLEKIKKALTGENNYLVLIDDAEKFESRDIADLIKIVKDITTNKVKLILTSRKYFSDDIFQGLKYYDSTFTKTHILSAFTSSETIEIIQNELIGYSGVKTQINTLAEITFGKPIMVMTLINSIKNGGKISEIINNNFLKNYVKSYFNQFAKKVSDENEIPKKTIVEFIRTISLIEPISIEDESLMELFINNFGITRTEIQKIFDLLVSQKIIAGYSEYSLKPDLYSDIILKEASSLKNWTKETSNKYSIYINKIIKNLSSLSDVEGNQDRTALDDLLKSYIYQIEQVSTTWELTKILDTINYVAYSKPKFAIDSLNSVISIFTNESHPLHSTLLNGFKVKNYSFDPIIKSINSTLAEISYNEYYCESVFSIATELNDFMELESIIPTVFGFAKNDHILDYNLKRQVAFYDIIIKQSILTNTKTLEFSIKALDEMLKLEFTGIESKPFKSHEITFTTYYIPEKESIIALRVGITNYLCNLFNKIENKALNDKILNIILKIPSSIFSAKNKNRYKGISEIDIIVKFLQKISSDNLELSYKQLIKEKIFWYKKWGIDNKYYNVIDEITKNLTKEDLAEQLMTILSPRYDGTIQDIESNLKNQISSIALKHSSNEIANSIIKIVEESNTFPPYLYTFLQQISFEQVEKTKQITDIIWGLKPEIILNHFSIIFSILYFDKDETEYTRNYFNLFLNLQSSSALNCILNTYSPYRIIKNNTIRKKLSLYDFELIEKIIVNNSQIGVYLKVSTLPVLLVIDSQKANSIIKKEILSFNSNEIDQLYSIFNFFDGEFYDEIKDITLTATYSLNFSYHFEMILSHILKKDGIDLIFNYFIGRVNYKRSLNKDGNFWGYEIVPNNSYGSLYKEIEDSIKYALFYKILDWYIDYNFELSESIFSKNIIEYFLPSNIFTLEIKRHYQLLIESDKLTLNRAVSIARSIGAFEKKNELLGEIVIELFEKSQRMFKDKDSLKKVQTELYIAFTSLGVKSGTVGKPFEVDLELKELLLKLIASISHKNYQVNNFLNSILGSVERDIQFSIRERGENEW